MNAEWLETAKNLPCGSKVKVYCCGSSPSMLVSHSEKGYSCHCFRCSEPDSHKFIPHGVRSIAELQRHKLELSENKNKLPYLPSDYTKVIPAKYAWFLRYGISLDVARSYDFGYSEFFHRIVIPIWRGLQLQAVHLRAISPEDKPKYLNLGRPAPDLLFWAHNDFDNDRSLVIVEDVISAIKVNIAGYNAVALNGSSITDVQAFRLASPNARYVWLDNDAAGKKGARDTIKQLHMQGCPDIRHVLSLDDPKTYSKDEISEHLKGASSC